MAKKPENNEPKKTKGFLGMFKKDVDGIHKNGYTRLQIAIKKGNRKKVRELLKLGAAPDFSGTRGPENRPLAIAIQSCHIKIAGDLLKAGASPDHHFLGCSYVSQAVSMRYPTLVDMLLKHGTDKNLTDLWTGETPLFHVSDHSAFMVSTLVDYGYDINAVNHEGRSALYQAVANRRFETAKKLLQHGADPNVKPADSPSLIALVMENANGRYDALWYMVKPLVEKGADINAVTPNNQSLFMLATAFDDLEMAIWAGRKCDNIKLKDTDGNTPLHIALKGKKPKVIRYVLSVYDRIPADKNAADTCVVGQIMDDADFYLKNPKPEALDIVKTMLDKGANIDVQGQTGRTMTHLAVEYKDDKLLELILKYKPDMEVRDENGYTPLCRAVLMDNLELVDRLLDQGANPNITNSKGWTILDLLSLERNDRTSPMVQRLMSAGGQYIKQLPANDHAAVAPPIQKKDTPQTQKGRSAKPPPRF